MFDLGDLGIRAFPELSDGLRLMTALVLDLAWRCAVTNPHFGADSARRSHGVVLIDEIDKHLHPTWQRTIVGTLRKSFPNLQFIATTHSPFVVQSVETESLINLDRVSSLDTERASIEDIAEVAMGVSHVQRSTAFRAKVEAARAYLRALSERPADADGLRRLKETLDAWQAKFGTDPVFVAALLQKRAASGVE